jgi:hypothetical protein
LDNTGEEIIGEEEEAMSEEDIFGILLTSLATTGGNKNEDA